jgi:hypothetical protein
VFRMTLRREYILHNSLTPVGVSGYAPKFSISGTFSNSGRFPWDFGRGGLSKLQVFPTNLKGIGVQNPCTI